MIFALAGATRQRVELRGYGLSDSRDRDGVSGGGGFEVAVDKDWMVGLQGEGTSYGNESLAHFATVETSSARAYGTIKVKC